jgi:hypothetical protein
MACLFSSVLAGGRGQLPQLFQEMNIDIPASWCQTNKLKKVTSILLARVHMVRQLSLGFLSVLRPAAGVWHILYLYVQ